MSVPSVAPARNDSTGARASAGGGPLGPEGLGSPAVSLPRRPIATLSAHSSNAALAAARATSLLGSAVAKQAAVLSYIDGLLAAAVGAYLCLIFTAFLRRH
jgi:hypothetical protein